MNPAIQSLAAQRALEAAAAAQNMGLMRRAACAAADKVRTLLPEPAPVTVLAGPGNNGGDALHLACELVCAGYPITVVSPAPQKGDEAVAARARWDAVSGHTVREFPADAGALIVDGLFGIGLSRAPAAPWDALIRAVNASGVPVLALDTPSGLDATRGTAPGEAIRARHTLTFLCLKAGLLTGDGPGLCGALEVAPLGVPPALWPPAEGGLNRPLLAPLARKTNSHKGSYGTVCVVGGSPGMLGAALLAGRAALALGAGKVHLSTLDARLAVDPGHPELMIAPHAPRLPAHQVCAIGPGLGQSGDARAALAAALAGDASLVVDADALNLVAADPALAERLATRQAPAVLTPHPAEAARLLGRPTAEVQADRVAAARTLARRFGQTVVLKGAGTLIARADGFYRANASGNAALAAAGQGDVLSGAIAALIAQHLPPFDAACLAVYLHGLTGDLYRARQGYMLGLAASQSAADLADIANALLLIHERNTI